MVEEIKRVDMETAEQIPTEGGREVRKPTFAESDSATEGKPREDKGSKQLVRPMKSGKKGWFSSLAMSVLIVVAGVATGYGLTKVKGLPGQGLKSSQEAVSQGVQVGDVVGSKDAGAFRDTVEGVLVRGGVDGEGTHHILREGGPSRNVYLTSSVVNLDPFVDHKVEVWGETFAAQKAGWLMDVGRVEVLELNADKPFEEEIVEETVPLEE